MRILTLAAAALTLAFTSGCAYIPGGTDLEKVALDSQLNVVTTGDGNFPEYEATGYYTGTEIGVGIGIPFVIKLFEIYPAASNEELLTEVARRAQNEGATSLINVKPQEETFIGFPFVFAGLYVDKTSGTGIK